MAAVLIVVLSLLGGGWLIYSNENPQTWGDAAQGRTIAESWCAGCHQISPQHAKPQVLGTQPPAFADIAKRPGFGDAWLETFLSEVHLPMPTYRLTPAERRQVVAYFGQLSKQ
jgi:mono/diheme cytochrome c family protein